MTAEDSVFLPVALGLVMFGIGLNLHFSNFKSVFVAPKAVIFGAFGQMVMLPVIAFAIAVFWPMDNIHKLGLILIAACPGGTASNLVTFLLRGRVELSVAMTTINSFLILLTIPFYIRLASRMFMVDTGQVEVGFWYVFSEIFFTVLIPVIAGMMVNSWMPDLTQRLRKPLRYILPAVLLCVFAVVLFGGNGSGAKDVMTNWVLFFPAFILNIASMLFGHFSSKFIGINHRGSYTIAIEVGLQNSVLAIYLASSIIGQEDVALMAVIYGSFSFFTTLGLGYLLEQSGYRNRRKLKAD